MARENCRKVARIQGGRDRQRRVSSERQSTCELHFNTLAGLGRRNGAAMTPNTAHSEQRGVCTCCSSRAGPFPRGTSRDPCGPATSATRWFSCRSVAITSLPQPKAFILAPNRTKCGFWSWKLVRGGPRLYKLLLYHDKDNLEKIGYLGSQC